MFDISADALIDIAPIHLKNSAGDYAYAGPNLPVRINLYGPGSEQFAMVEARQAQRAVKRMQDNDNKVTLPPPEERTREQAEDLADLTDSFENFDYPAPGKSGRDLFMAFYADKKMVHYHRQVLKAINDAGNWRPGAAGTAKNG